jgi:hypothetical protein
MDGRGRGRKGEARAEGRKQGRKGVGERGEKGTKTQRTQGKGERRS